MKAKASREEAGASATKDKSGKIRLDLLLVQRGLVPSRERAQALILAGKVRVNNCKAEKSGSQTKMDAQLEVVGEALRYASRGGLKLEGALEDFGLSPDGKVCLDVGSSAGGFTDCLLQHGARRVYAVDVNVRQLDWKLQKDERVVAIERNARYLKADDVGSPIELVVMDVSFISVVKVLPAVAGVAQNGTEFLLLVKPQFELEKREVGKGGIVRDPQLHHKAVERVASAASQAGLELLGAGPSRVAGAEGNQEFFLHARRAVE
jgi:23S rRNA (cytidine1920-2'-O)/16S rRNA (cytidine1409-2'-O)-methyltransferase